MSENVRTSWSDLVSAALIGTDRRPFGPDPSSPAGTDPAQALLNQAARLAIPALTGSEPARYDGPSPERAPADDRPLIPHRARLRLHALLDVYPKYLGEWLSEVRAAGFRVPSATLPGLLDAGRGNTAIRTPLAQVLGERGHWLARQNPDWRYLLREPIGPLRPQDWDGPDPDARIAYANGLYAADPDAARALFAAAWPTSTAAVKMSLLGVVDRFCTDEDRPFLAGLARDPSKQVREEAHGIEARLMGRDPRAARLSPEAFTAEAARIAATQDPINDLYRFAAPQSSAWPLDGARVILAALADNSREQPAGEPGDSAAASQRIRGTWSADQLIGMLADRGPVQLHPEVEQAVRAQTTEIAAGVAHRFDFTALLTPLGFRADMHAELTAPPSDGQE